ncbi:hypothetical protein [Arthrobacter sp. PM3]|nr:hypothetical protein [Arthrobacter sp. PM3]
MPQFALEGVTHEYLMPDPDHSPEVSRSWEYGNYPKVMKSQYPVLP